MRPLFAKYHLLSPPNSHQQPSSLLPHLLRTPRLSLSVCPSPSHASCSPQSRCCCHPFIMHSKLLQLVALIASTLYSVNAQSRPLANARQKDIVPCLSPDSTWKPPLPRKMASMIYEGSHVWLIPDYFSVQIADGKFHLKATPLAVTYIYNETAKVYFKSRDSSNVFIINYDDGSSERYWLKVLITQSMNSQCYVEVPKKIKSNVLKDVQSIWVYQDFD